MAVFNAMQAEQPHQAEGQCPPSAMVSKHILRQLVMCLSDASIEHEPGCESVKKLQVASFRLQPGFAALHHS